jgi:hypothetical protein
MHRTYRYVGHRFGILATTGGGFLTPFRDGRLILNY